MLRARQENVRDKHNKIVVSKASDQTTIESIVSAQHGFITVQDIVKTANIAILKIQSILVSRTNKVHIMPTKLIFQHLRIICITRRNSLYYWNLWCGPVFVL